MGRALNRSRSTLHEEREALFVVEDCSDFHSSRHLGGGGGGAGGLNIPPPAPCTPAPFHSGSRLCALFLLRNIVPVLRNISHFSRLPPLLDIPPPAPSSPASRRPPVPITPGLPPPCPPPHLEVMFTQWTRRWIIQSAMTNMISALWSKTTSLAISNSVH